MPQNVFDKMLSYVNHTLLTKLSKVQDKGLISPWSRPNLGGQRFYVPVEFHECPEKHHTLGLVDSRPGALHGTQYRFMCLNCDTYIYAEYDFLWNPSAYNKTEA